MRFKCTVIDVSDCFRQSVSDIGSWLICNYCVSRVLSGLCCLPAGASLDCVSVRRPDHSHLELAVSHMHWCADRAQSLRDVRGVSPKGRLGRLCQPRSDGARPSTPIARQPFEPGLYRRKSPGSIYFARRPMITVCIA